VPLYEEEVQHCRCKGFDRELIVNTNYHSYTILALKKSQSSFPVIEPILKNGVQMILNI
jgi:hypothetical protein